MLGRDELVAHFGGQLLGGVDRGQRLPGQLRLRGRATAAGEPVGEALSLGPNGRGLDADRFEQRAGNAVGLPEQRQQQMGGPDLRVAGGTGGLQRGGQGRLGFSGRVERVHSDVLRFSW